MKYFILGFLLLVSGVVCAEKKALTDIDREYVYDHATYTANSDYTHEELHETATKVLKERAIEDLKTFKVSYSTSVEKIEILEAYNSKANGTRVDAPKTNYQVETNSGRNKDDPVFSDQSEITTVFPEVQVGDTLVFKYKRIITEPMFPHYFAESNSFSEAAVYDDVVIKMDVPKTYLGKYQIRGMSEKISRKDGRITYEWKWKNTIAMKDNRKDYSVWDMETNPGFAYTTFDSYQAIAEEYGVRALPKVVVNEKVNTLADSIVDKEENPKEQARLLYEWVSTHITYAGNCIGVGAVVPHDISFILDNMMGDCKDHATLLQALLTAKDIKATQALVNATSVYKLPSIPAVNWANHVINYLPDFDLFVDSTSDSTPFGMLPFSDQDKPVLLVQDFQEGKKTPVTPAGKNRQVMNAILNIQADGSANGSIDFQQAGRPAVQSRSAWRNLSKDREDEWLKKTFSGGGKVGSETIEKDDPKPLLDTFHYKVTFEKPDYMQMDGAGGLYIYPLMYGSFSIANVVRVDDEPEREVEIACDGGYSEENYTLVFPANVKILDIPNNRVYEGSDLKYRATYRQDGNTITISRVLDDATKGAICKPDLILAQREILLKVKRDLRAQIVYKPLMAE
jgi:transglutaminase-like putative cysteine protease